MLVKYFILRGILIPTKVLGRYILSLLHIVKIVKKKTTLRKEKVGVNKCENSLRVKFSMDVSEQ